MNNKKILLVAFILIALAQLFVPAKMIWDREDIIKSGTEHKFKTAPIDPNDPFRGKYITLRYADNSIEVKNGGTWNVDERVYVSFKTDADGYSVINSISKEEPTDNSDYLKTKVWIQPRKNNKVLTIEYPFERYYMEESKAYDAELAYRETRRDTSRMTYALVNIKNGGAVLRDVLIDGVPIREIVKISQAEGKE